VSAIPYQHLTHINYSFVLPTSSGGLTSIDTSRLKSLVDTAHSRGVKVNIAIGGWNDGQRQRLRGHRRQLEPARHLRNNVAQYVTAHNLDGVDIDWEYPDRAAPAPTTGT
jgi:GH18 family chitinase